MSLGVAYLGRIQGPALTSGALEGSAPALICMRPEFCQLSMLVKGVHYQMRISCINHHCRIPTLLMTDNYLFMKDLLDSS